jgi:hypothetical protein
MAVMRFTADQAIEDGKKFGLELKDQINFIRQLSGDLGRGKYPGYPKQAGWSGSQPVSGDIAGHADNPGAKDAKSEWGRARDDDDGDATADPSDDEGSPAPGEVPDPMGGYSDGTDDDPPNQHVEQDDPPPPAQSPGNDPGTRVKDDEGGDDEGSPAL